MTEFKLGEVVKIWSHDLLRPDAQTGTVIKVWKNGVIEVRNHAGTTNRFNPDGRQRGASYCSLWVKHLENGATAESIQAAARALKAKALVEYERKETERQAAIDVWWKDTGKQMWADRLWMPDFNGKEVVVIQFEQGNEQRMAFVVLEINKRQTFTAKVGGLIGGLISCESVSTYSSSHRGDSLEEILYDITH